MDLMSKRSSGRFGMEVLPPPSQQPRARGDGLGTAPTSTSSSGPPAQTSALAHTKGDAEEKTEEATDSTPPPQPQASSSSSVDTFTSPDGEIVEYQAGLWEKQTWVWTAYDAKSAKMIFKAKSEGSTTMKLSFGAAHNYVIDLVKLTQTNQLSNKVRKIRFVTATSQ